MSNQTTASHLKSAIKIVKAAMKALEAHKVDVSTDYAVGSAISQLDNALCDLEHALGCERGDG